jgi:hypothetical protein
MREKNCYFKTFLKNKYSKTNHILTILFILMILLSPLTILNSIGANSYNDSEIKLNENNYYTQTNPIELITDFHEDSALKNGEKEFGIIHFRGPILQSWKDKVVDLRAEIIGYFGEFSILTKLDEESKERILKLPFIIEINPYIVDFKYNQDYFNTYLLDYKLPTLDLIIQIYPGIEGSIVFERLYENIQTLGGEIISKSNDRLLIRIDPDRLNQVAGLNDVLWLEPAPQFSYFNDVAAGIIDVKGIWSNTWLDGSGQIVTVCDTGLDNGSYSNLHEDFRGRLVNTYTLGRNGDWSDADIGFVGGHGTHVSGSVLGGGNWSNGQIKGMAYNASLVMQSTMTISGNMNIPFDMYQGLYYPPYNNDNSRIHTNSWGDPQYSGQYATWSNITDSFIWDYKDQVILFAAGNIFISNKVSTPGTAKNVITVGASESYRATPIFSGHESDCDNIDQVASFSCYGTDDKRIKPDVVAPGSGILSTRSSLIPDPNNHYWKNYDAFYAYAGGTSMSTPITAGAVTLIRQYYTDIELLTKPSGALIKATLINGAEDMPSSGGSQPIPNDKEGWGRINISRSINPEPPGILSYIDNNTGLTNLKNISYTIEVLNDSIPLNISLVWSDFPAAPSATTALVNDLHLNVTHDTTGKSYKGNVFNNGWSSDDDSYANQEWDRYDTGYDNINNVECLRLKKPDVGRYTLKVVGSNIPFGPQPFSIALSGGLNPNFLHPVNVKIETVPAGSALNLSWNRIRGPDVIGYEIFRSLSPDSGFVSINKTSGPNVGKYQDTDLVDGTTYYYKLRTKYFPGQFSNNSSVVSGSPMDSIAPWIVVSNPSTGSTVNQDVGIAYSNESDCNKITFKYYNDTNQNNIPDDSNTWVLIGTDTILSGIFWWNTTMAGAGPGNQNSVILSVETFDEVPNSKFVYIRDIRVDNQPPSAPVLEQFTQSPINYTNIIIKGTAEYDSQVIIYSNQKKVGFGTTGGDMKFNVTVELSDGLNLITARAIDYLGNGPGTTSSSMEIMVDQEPPVADSGGNFIIDEDTWFTFNGNKSYDTNSDDRFNNITDFRWNFKTPNGTKVSLEGKEVEYYFDTIGNYSVKLNIQDMAGNWGELEFWILVLDKTIPDAQAGEDLTWDEDKVLFLSANRSTDNDPEFFNTANFTWDFYDYNPNKIDQGKIMPIQLFGIDVSYAFSVPDTYIVNLNVTDRNGNRDLDVIEITIRDITPPKAEAGSDKIIEKGRSILLDATGSTDNDPSFFETGNFTWYFNYIGEDIYLYGSQYEFRFNKSNVFTIRLTVSDEWGNKDTAEIIVRVNADIFLPTVEWTYPAENSWNIQVSTLVKIKLNETLDLKRTSLNLSTFQLVDSQYNNLDGELRYDPNESLILFIPTNILNFGESYTVFLSNTLTDLAGNPLDGNKNGLVDSDIQDMFKFVFSTMNMTRNPTNNQKNVPMDTLITIGFSGNFSLLSLNSANITLVNGKSGSMEKGIMEIDNQTLTIKFKPDKKLAQNTEYQVILRLKFYLQPISMVSWDTNFRMIESKSENAIDNTTTNITLKNYSWTFKTKTLGSDDGEVILGLNLFSFLLLMVLIILIIIITAFLLLWRKKKMDKDKGVPRKKSIKTERYDDEDYYPYPDYDEEHLYDYDEYEDWESQSKRARVRKSHGRAVDKRTVGRGRIKGRRRRSRRTTRMQRARVRRRDFEDERDLEYEEEPTDEFEIEMMDEDEFEIGMDDEGSETDIDWDEEEGEEEGEEEEYDIESVEEFDELEFDEEELEDIEPEELEELEEKEKELDWEE